MFSVVLRGVESVEGFVCPFLSSSVFVPEWEDEALASSSLSFCQTMMDFSGCFFNPILVPSCKVRMSCRNILRASRSLVGLGFLLVPAFCSALCLVSSARVSSSSWPTLTILFAAS